MKHGSSNTKREKMVSLVTTEKRYHRGPSVALYYLREKRKKTQEAGRFIVSI